MADLKLVFIAVMATLLMCQLASARPNTAPTGEEGLSLKSIEASMNIAVDDVKKNLQDLATKTEKVLTDIRNAAQSPETQKLLNSWNDQLALLASNVTNTAKKFSSHIQSSIPANAPAS